MEEDFNLWSLPLHCCVALGHLFPSLVPSARMSKVVVGAGWVD